MSRVRDALARHGLAPSRARGQNFLRSAELAARLVDLAGVVPDDAAVEIGPGLGALTRPLAAVARRTVALELDRGLVQALHTSLDAAELPPSLEVRHQDALSADLGSLARELGDPVVLLGNLPYSISGRLLGRLLGPRNPFRTSAFMLQAEVADRLLAGPGEPAYGTLSVWARLYARARRALELGPDQFEPRPQVRSTFVVLERRSQLADVADERLLRQIVRSAFQYRRKMLRRALRGAVVDPAAALEAAQIDPRRRGETLSEDEFVALSNAATALTAPTASA